MTHHAHLAEHRQDESEHDADEQELRVWFALNRRNLTARRNAWRTYSDTWPRAATVSVDDELPGVAERLSIELREHPSREHQAPSPSMLAVIAGADPRRALDDAHAAAAALHPHMLLHVPKPSLPDVVREAIQIVAPLHVALAIRSFDPCAELAGVYEAVPTTTTRLRRMHKAALALGEEAAALERFALLRRARLGDAHAEAFAAQAAQLQRAAVGFEAWTQWRASRAESEQAAVERLALVGEKQSPVIEQAMAAAKKRWWLPLNRALRAHGWTPRDFAELLAADVWCSDLVPHLRRKWQMSRLFADEPAGRSRLLLDQIRAVGRAR